MDDFIFIWHLKIMHGSTTKCEIRVEIEMLIIFLILFWLYSLATIFRSLVFRTSHWVLTFSFWMKVIKKKTLFYFIWIWFIWIIDLELKTVKAFQYRKNVVRSNFNPKKTKRLYYSLANFLIFYLFILSLRAN